MAILLLLNGPPASGKSTLAARLVASRPLALNLDIDVVRGLLGAWIDRPADAGLAARALAISMARTHLAAGHDVVVPQFLGRVAFIEELERLAEECGVGFVEVALILERNAAIRAFADRSRTPTTQSHADAANLVERSGSPDAVADMYDLFAQLLAQRPRARRVDVEFGDIEGTLQRLEAAIIRR